MKARQVKAPFRARLASILTVALCLALSAIPANASHLDKALSLDDARHVLMRTGLGASPGELLYMIGKSRRWAVQNIIDGLQTNPANPLPAWVNAPAPHYWARSRMPAEQRRRFNDERDDELVELRQWWVREMIETRSPQTEKLTLFWHNHFTSAYAEINHQSTSIARQHQTLRRLSSGNFRDLLVAVLRDPAMLNYLDNNNNRKQAPNENLARELLELFTLGEGNYSEQDVRGAARALTGYTVAPAQNMSAHFKPWHHDNGSKILFGETGNFNADSLVDLILARPEVATFIATKFYRAYVSENSIDPEALEQLATGFRQSGYQIKTLYRELLQSEAFWHADNRDAIVKSPVDLAIGTIRSTGQMPHNWQTLPTRLSAMGQNLFHPPNVAGWPGGENWVTTERLLTRLNWLDEFAHRDCDQARTQPCNMSANAPAMMMTNTMDGAQNHAHLTIQLAAENYLGAPGYQVSLLKDQQDVWQSAEQLVSGGHDTKKLGRLQPGVDMPWQQVHLPIGASVPEFDQIRVSFLNDKGGRDGDRNLYVNWVEIDEKRYPSSMGIQRSNCPPKQKEQAGALYCAGDLLLSTPLASAKPPSSPDQLTAEAVYLNWLGDPSRAKRPTLTLTLTDVSFNSRQWHNLSVRFQLDRGGDYSMSMVNHECWPDCVTRWPACARTANNQPALRALDFPLQSSGDDNCHYRLLSNEDRLLVDTLWMQLPTLYATVATNIEHVKKKQASQFKQWRPHVDNMKRQLATSLYSRSTTREALITGTPVRRIPTRTMPSSPRPGGHTSEDLSAQMAQLQKAMPGFSLQSLLLADRKGRVLDDSNPGSLLQQLDYQIH